jgi:hypothetical protein
MYFKISMRTNPDTGVYSGYYRLVESYRNAQDRVCHRTILNVGHLDNLTPDQLNQIRRILTQKVDNCCNPLFEVPFTDDPIVNQYVETLYNRMVAEKRIDVLNVKNIQSGNIKGKDIQAIDINSIRSKDVKEVGAEWLSYQAVNQLQIGNFLANQGWNSDDIKLALTHIISRAVYPASELETTRWIKENSAVCEVTGYDAESITKDKLYRISHRLFSVQKELELHLSQKTNELFDIQDKILLYDLTNTYFEGRKEGSIFAKHGRSKEKRSDAKLIVLALVVNPQGFIKYSAILKGNMTDSKTLKNMILELRNKTSSHAQKALVVIDAGIATEENLAMIVESGFDYLCVSRSNIKNYSVDAGSSCVAVTDNRKRRIELCNVKTENSTDYYLKVQSPTKELKERSMNELFKTCFEEGLQRIADGLKKKGGVKREDKVHERIGRLKQKYPSIHRYYDIWVEAESRLDIDNEKDANQNRTVCSLRWSIKEGVDINARSGIYFLRTSLKTCTEQDVWTFYNTIREIEATFRVLKTDLDLRPIYHKNDDSTMAHLHLGLLAYWVVNTIRHQLKQKSVNHGWKEIVRLMNTQKAVTTVAQNVHDQVIIIRRCSEPTQRVRQIFDVLKYKHTPFVKKKFVVHKSELKKNESPYFREFDDG